MARAPRNQARLDFRAPVELKTLIERAAAMLGLSVSEYAKVTLAEKSREVIESNELRILSDRDRDLFLALLDAPPAPNAALQKAAARFRAAVEDGSLVP